MLSDRAGTQPRYTAISRRLFEMVDEGERDFDKLQAAAVELRDNVVHFQDYAAPHNERGQPQTAR